MEFDLDTRPSLANFFVVGMMALLFIVLGKVILSKYHVPGLSELFLAA